jgi:hypothetical protein
MKVIVVKPKKEKQPRKPRREQFIIMSRKLWDIPIGHITTVAKAYYLSASCVEFRKYLKKMYRGSFTLIGESKKVWIIKRIKIEEFFEDKDQEARRRRFYFPQGAARNSEVGSS